MLMHWRRLTTRLSNVEEQRSRRQAAQTRDATRFCEAAMAESAGSLEATRLCEATTARDATRAREAAELSEGVFSPLLPLVLAMRPGELTDDCEVATRMQEAAKVGPLALARRQSHSR